MKRKEKSNLFLIAVGILYLVFTIVQLLKSVFSFNSTNIKKEKWVEEPLLIEN